MSQDCNKTTLAVTSCYNIYMVVMSLSVYNTNFFKIIIFFVCLINLLIIAFVCLELLWDMLQYTPTYDNTNK